MEQGLKEDNRPDFHLFVHPQLYYMNHYEHFEVQELHEVHRFHIKMLCIFSYYNNKYGNISKNI